MRRIITIHKDGSPDDDIVEFAQRMNSAVQEGGIVTITVSNTDFEFDVTSFDIEEFG